MKNLIILNLCVALLISCDKKNDNASEIKQINYGTSFGECVGYCKSDVLLRAGLVAYSRSSWVDTIETITCSEILPDEGWNAFKNGLNLNDFFNLPDTIGCPDCADGGAEWIEIEVYSGKKHKVVFEYMNEPTELEDYLIGLREQNEKSINCGEY